MNHCNAVDTLAVVTKLTKLSQFSRKNYFLSKFFRKYFSKLFFDLPFRKESNIVKYQL